MLNAAQQEAVRKTEGRILILAGAGTGKTRVIVHRIAHLVREKGVLPDSICALTFTNKAAAEMRERTEPLIGAQAARKVTLSTFHSFCCSVLRKEIGHLGYTRDFSLYDERDMERVVKSLARDILGHSGELPSLAPIRLELSEAANRGGDTPYAFRDSFSQDLYQRLQSTLRACNAVSFDNLIQLAIRLFQERKDILEIYQQKCRYLMIDEYQDTNPAQFCLAELLAKGSNSLCVVGDDDQSIYGWRGAEVSHILRFQADSVIKLEHNYRSTEQILAAANGVIEKNKNRHEKKLLSKQGPGSLIEVFNAPTDAEEAEGIVQRILTLKEKKRLKWRDIAILYRSNALSRQFEISLMHASWQKEGHWVRGIPYEVYGGLEFSERGEIKDLFAYLRVIANPRDEEALLRILNVPRRSITDKFLDKVTQKNRSEKIPLWQALQDSGSLEKEHPKGVCGARAFLGLIEKARQRFSQSKLSDSLIWLLEEADFKRAIAEEVKSEKMRLFKWENVQECVNALAQYEDGAQNPSLQEFISQSSLGKPMPKRKQADEDKVRLMTLHSAKGLEFPACFIAGLEDHILPHEKSAQQTGVEEERRLFYVGITRAKRFLTLSMARSRMKMGKARPTSPSRFLFEIPKHLLKATSCK